MALVCDYCGDVTEAAERIDVAFAHNQEIALKGATAQQWYAYCEGECADAVKAMLDNLRLFAVQGEGSGLMWQLVEQKKAGKPKEVKPASAVAEAPKPSGRSGPIRAKGDDGEPLWKTNSEVAERAGRLPLSWWLKKSRRDRSEPDMEELRNGVSIATVVTHQASKGSLWNQGIYTLKDVSEFTEVEFMGLPGVGQKVFNDISHGLRKNGFEFREGPSLDQLGRFIKGQRETAGLDLDDVIPIVLNALEAPETRTLGGEDRSRAYWHVEALLRSCESGSKGAPPEILDVLAETLGVEERDALLGQAAELGDLA